MGNDSLSIVPVVIVGKNRTRMTCAVIDAVKKHLINATPYFICVSDRSREGHDQVVERHLKDIGETQFKILQTLPDEDRYGWGAALNIGLSFAFEGDDKSPFALVLDNDWILQKDLDCDKYLYTFLYSSIGGISFKPIHGGTNITVREITLIDGSKYLLREQSQNSKRVSFTAEIGCMMITQKMYAAFGKFKENCVTDETEWGFCDWYNSLSDEQRENEQLWFATDKELLYHELNGKEHVFTHIGLISQHEGPHKWQVPERYRYLSDDVEDARVCEQASDKDDIDTSNDERIEWGKYFDRIFCVFHLPLKEREDRIKSELCRVGILDSGIFEWRYTVPSRFDSLIQNSFQDQTFMESIGAVNGTLEQIRILKESLLLGYDRILILEDDVAFMKDLRIVRQALDALPAGYDIIQCDKGLGPDQLEELKYISTHPINKYFADKTGHHLPFSDANIYTRKGMEEAVRILEQRPMAVDQIDRTVNLKSAVAIDNLCIQVFFARTNYSNSIEIHQVYSIQGIDYKRYAIPDGYGMGKLYNPPVLGNNMNRKSNTLDKKGRKFISVYAIAKNEASVAARWYECVKESDEVCVLDTGSTDDTVNILRELGARVEVKTYEDWSFAVARNDSMQLVSPCAEILFTLDLDETIAPGWRKKLEDAWIKEEGEGKLPVGCQYKYIWSFYPDGREMQSFAVRKIHAKGTGTWRYRCHEVLQEVHGHVFFLNNFVVEHHQNRQTSRRKYITLLEKDARERPEDDRSAYYYARELMYNQEWEKAIAEFKRHLSLKSAGWRAERASSMRNIARCYGELKNQDEKELWYWKAALEDETNREATYELGVMAMKAKDYRTAIKVLALCVKIEKPSLEYISAPVVWTAHPWFLYAQALWWTNRWDEAISACQKALEIDPQNQAVKKQLAGMIETRNRFAEKS